jgi:MFS family permease
VKGKLHRFLYLDQLGASKHLMSVSVALTCVAEVPVFHFAGALIERLGLAGASSAVLLAFVVRLAAYSTMSLWPTLWLILAVEPLHGVTFGLAWATGTAFAKAEAPPGLEATMQSAFASCYFGLGTGLGGLIGGWTYGALGPAGCFAAAAAVVFVGWVLAAGAGRALAAVPPARAPQPSTAGHDAAVGVC